MINVLSLFDGISGAQLALKRAKIKVNSYFASEIDKYAKSVTMRNFPGTVQVGDICQVNGNHYKGIDLLVAGSPCQGFSNCGKGLNFDDPRSKLFFEFVRILEEAKPKYFLLENVRMKKEWSDAITNILGVEPIMINSSLVSAQNRTRLYWTNIPGLKQPQDKKILLPSILENGVVDRNKSYCLDASYYKGTSLENYIKKKRRQVVFMPSRKDYKNNIRPRTDGKSNSVTCKTNESFLLIDECANIRRLTPTECERLQTFPDEYTYGLSNTQRYKCLGNSFTVDVIKHIFSFMPGKQKKAIDKNKIDQLLFWDQVQDQEYEKINLPSEGVKCDK